MPKSNTCPGCKNYKPALRPEHNWTPGACKRALTLARRSHTRQGRHPRQGRTPAADDESKEARAQNLDGTGFADPGETPEAFPEPTVGGSSSSTARPGNPVGTRAAHTRHRGSVADAGIGTERKSDSLGLI